MSSFEEIEIINNVLKGNVRAYMVQKKMMEEYQWKL